MTQIHMMSEGGMYHLHFWCNNYNPHRIWHPKEKYCVGEEICKECAIFVHGIMYRAKFQCTREPTPTFLSRFALKRNPMGFFYDIKSPDIPVKEQKKIAELFEWLYGREIETKRKHAKKITEASKKRTDIHGAENGAPTRIFYENPITTKLGEPEVPTGTPEVKSGFEPTFGSIPPIANGVQKVSEIPMRNNNTPLYGEVVDKAVSEMRAANDVQGNRKQPVACVRAVFEPAMKEEYDTSYGETSAHACITCKCGTKVWYGCGRKHTSRPKYCRSCTEVEKHKLQENLAGIEPSRLEEIFVKNLRREIIK